MTLTTVSGRIDSATKAKANRYIQSAGFTPNDIIRNIWNYIAQTGEIPEVASQQILTAQEQKKAALQHMLTIADALPTGSPLATMSDNQLREEWARREF